MIRFSKVEILYIIAAFLFGLTIMLAALQFMFAPPRSTHTITANKPKNLWQIESIDTMKYSRDMAKQDLTDGSYALGANRQMARIAQTGANYVAIDTPYDAEFLPVMKIWVQAARANGLHVWFRGNFSGWEGWFNYAPITEQEHTAMTKQFILNNSSLFQDTDIFTSCPECENGIHLNIGDQQAVAAYRSFLINEYNTDNEAFATIGKKVNNGFYSMNADAAKAIMDKATTQELGGIVVIDHYVKTPEELLSGVVSIAAESGGKVVLGEFGAPIPDLQGNMTEAQQKDWLDQSLQLLSTENDLLGVNYWVNEGGSTALWNQDGSPRSAVSVITKYYHNNF